MLKPRVLGEGTEVTDADEGAAEVEAEGREEAKGVFARFIEPVVGRVDEADCDPRDDTEGEINDDKEREIVDKTPSNVGDDE